MNRSPELHRLRLFPLALVLVVACSSTEDQSDFERVNDMIRHAQYEEAVRASARLARERPDSERIAELHRGATIAWYLESGRELSFEDRDEEALEQLEKALALDPESEVVAVWVDKTKAKLAQRWLDCALELHANDDLSGAIDAYGCSLTFVPGGTSALTGLGHAVRVVNYREGLAEEYYNDGMHALSDYWLEQARACFSYSHKYGDNERTDRRRDHVDDLLAEERVVVALTLEHDGHYGAARNEFRLALVLDEDNEEAHAGHERNVTEAEASAKLREAHMSILRSDYEKAEALIDEGLAISTRQADLFEGARVDIQESLLDNLYDNALNLEKDFLYPQAGVRSWGGAEACRGTARPSCRTS